MLLLFNHSTLKSNKFFFRFYWVEIFIWIPPLILEFQLEVCFKVYRLLIGLTAQQKGTTSRWFSNKTTLVLAVSSLSRYIGYFLALKENNVFNCLTLNCAHLQFCYWPVVPRTSHCLLKNVFKLGFRGNRKVSIPETVQRRNRIYGHNDRIIWG